MAGPNQRNHENDPQKLWQNQPREEMTMTLDIIRKKAQTMRARTQRELLGNLITIPACVGIAWFGFLHTQHLGFRIAFVAAVAWAILGQYPVHRGMWSATPPERAGLITGLDFYRREIARRRNLLGRFLQWTLGPVLLSATALVVLLTGMARSVGKPGAAVPFATLGVVWLVFVFILRSRHQRGLKQENDELNQIERTAGQARPA